MTVLQHPGTVYVTNATGSPLPYGAPALIGNRCGIVVKQNVRPWKLGHAVPTVADGAGCLLLVDGVTEIDDLETPAALGDVVYINDTHDLTANPTSDDVQDIVVAADGGTFALSVATGADATIEVEETNPGGVGGGGDGIQTVTVFSGSPAVNEIQTVSVFSGDGGDSFTLTLSGQTTGAIAWDASAADVKAALEALSNVDPGAITCTLDANIYTITFGGNLAGTNVPLLVEAETGCTVDVAEGTPGSPADSFTLTLDDQTTAAISWEATGAQVKAALEALSNVDPGAITCVLDGNEYTITFGGNWAGLAVPTLVEVETGCTVDVAVVATGGGGNEIQTITITDATGGTFALDYDGDVTTALAHDATAAAVQAALRLLDSVGGANVTVAGPDGGPYVVTFIGTLASTDVDLIVADDSLLVPNCITVPIAHNASAATMKSALEGTSYIAPGDVTVTKPGAGHYVVTFGGSLADANIAQMTADDSLLTLTDDTASVTITTVGEGGVSGGVVLGRCVAAAGSRGLKPARIRVDLDDKG